MAQGRGGQGLVPWTGERRFPPSGASTGGWPRAGRQLGNDRAASATAASMKHALFGDPDIASRRPQALERPCWVVSIIPAGSTARARGWLQPLARCRSVPGAGADLSHPSRQETPLDEFTVVDVVRATLGVGPCEYILDVEGQGTAMRGRATCAHPRCAGGHLRQPSSRHGSRPRSRRSSPEVVIFVKHIRGRIESTSHFGHEMLAYMEQQRKAHPGGGRVPRRDGNLTRGPSTPNYQRQSDTSRPRSTWST